MSEEREDRHFLCMTCGRLKHEDLFHEGDCTCTDCYEEDRHAANFHEAPDGDGYVRSNEGDN